MFDLSTLTVETPVTFDVPVIFDTDGEAVTGFKILGKNSPEYQAALEAARVDAIKKAGRRKAQLDTSTDDGATALAHQIAASEVTVALAVVVDWFGFTADGALTPFNKATVEAMFAKYPTWREKVAAALENDANFFKA